MIEWDEALDSDSSGLNGGSGGQVPTIVVSATLKAVQDSTSVDTVGVLHSIEDTYGLAHLGGSAADGTIDSLLQRPIVPPPTTTPLRRPRRPLPHLRRCHPRRPRRPLPHLRRCLHADHDHRYPTYDGAIHAAPATHEGHHATHHNAAGATDRDNRDHVHRP